MTSPAPKDTVRIELTPAQQAHVRNAIGRPGEVLELSVTELEERIAPRLASNHNEVLLTER